jgi:hypothetical protein
MRARSLLLLGASLMATSSWSCAGQTKRTASAPDEGEPTGGAPAATGGGGGSRSSGGSGGAETGPATGGATGGSGTGGELGPDAAAGTGGAGGDGDGGGGGSGGAADAGARGGSAGKADAGASSTGGGGSPPAGDAPNKGWIQWNGDYKLQNWTTKPDAEVFGAPGGGEYWTKLTSGDWAAGVKGRVEMRWPDWPDQGAENMVAADVMYEPGTDGTCIMQIKTNTGSAGHESVYLNVHDNGNLYHGVNKTVIVANGAGTWHNIKAAYNPTTGLARVWIDNALKFQQSYPAGTGAVWYFKNGCYWASGTSKAHFKNVTFWRNPAKQ